jgi:CRISPR system Cascade subunit CasB
MAIEFNKETGIGRVLLNWWEGLEDDRASRAVLRRASSITAVSLTPPYQRLYQRLLTVGWDEKAKPYQNDSLAAVVGLLAHVEQNDGRAPAKAMSQKGVGEDRPPVSELRFMRLLESPDLDSLFIGLRRALPLVKHSVGVLALANDVVHWGDAVKKEWAYSYEWPEKSKS